MVQLLLFPRQEPSNFLVPGDSDELRRVQHLGIPLDADGVVSLREVASRSKEVAQARPNSRFVNRRRRFR